MIKRIFYGMKFYSKIYYHRYLHKYFNKNKNVKCIACGWKGKSFHDIHTGYGKIDYNSTCPACYSQRNHRNMYLLLRKKIPKKKKLKVLHIAPEISIRKLFKSYKNVDYLSVDLDKRRAMLQADITNLPFQNNHFDIIFCSHVLEHIENDKLAITELYRVLNKKGFAIIDVPIDSNRNKTYFDPSIKTPLERKNAYRHHEHLRLYGNNFPKILESAGFKVSINKIYENFNPQQINKYGLNKKPTFVCKK